MGAQPDLAAAKSFVELNARLVDRHRFAHHFLGAPANPVLEALRPYQNGDGGFGHGLEPDVRAPVSQPAAVESALEMLDQIACFDDPMVAQACDWLAANEAPGGGIPFCLPSIRDHPHAPWWVPDERSRASLIMTGLIAGRFWKNRVEHPWLDHASGWLWQQTDSLGSVGPYEMRGLFAFLDHVDDRERAERAFERLGRRIFDDELVALDPEQPGEVHTPLDFAPEPTALARQLFDDAVIERHLDALASGQREDGGWMFTWQSWAPLVELEWRGWLTVRSLLTLGTYGHSSVAPSTTRTDPPEAIATG